METKIYNYNDSSYVFTQGITIETPLKCPNCGLPTAFSNKFIQSDGIIGFFVHTCPACSKSSYSLQRIADKKGELSAFYPKSTPESIPNILLEHAPNFSRFYAEACQADSDGLISLAGTGYRSSAECLIKDYALDFELDSKEAIAKQPFVNAITKYLEDTLVKSADVVRIFGNDYTHWTKENNPDLSTTKYYLNILILAIQMKFAQKYPPVQR